MSESLTYYQGLGYGKINSFLRDPDFKESLLETNSDDEIVNHINNIDSKLKYNDLPDIYYFRGISGSFIPQAVQSSSGIIVNTAFTSTTSNEKVVQSFVDSKGCCVLVFKIPPYLKTYKYSYSGYSEDEILVERNTQFKIIKEGKKNYYFAELYKYIPPQKTNSTIIVEQLLEEARKKQLENLDIDFSDEDF